MNEPADTIHIPLSDTELVRRQRLLNIMLAVTAAATLLILAMLIPTSSTDWIGTPEEIRALYIGVFLALVGCGVVYLLNRHVSVELASALYLILLIVLIASSDDPMQVVNGRGLLLFTIPILAASVLLRPWASLVMAGVSGLTVFVVGQFIAGQAVPNIPAILAFFVFATVSYLSANSLRHALEKLRTVNAALQESEERFRRTFLHTPFPIMIHAEDGTVVDVNRTWTEITGYAPSEIPTIDVWTEKAYRDRKDHVRAQIDQLYDLDSRVKEGEYRIRTKTGEERIWLFSSAPLEELPDGRQVVISVATDITERKQMEQALRRQRDFSNTLVQSSPAFFVALDPTGAVRMMNASMLHGLGCEAEDVVGADYVRTFIPESDREEVSHVFQRITQHQEPTINESKLLTRSGDELLVEWHGQPVLGPDGEIDFFFGVGIDITRRKRAEEALRESYEELQARAEKLVALNELAHTLGAGVELSKLMPRFLSAVVELTGADGAVVDILDPEHHEFFQSYHRNLPPASAHAVISVGVGMAGRVVETGEPILAEDYPSHPLALESMVEAGVRSALSVPLMTGDKTIGALGLFEKGHKRPPLSPDDLGTAQAAGRLAAVAVQRARLFQAEREQRELARALAGAAAVISGTLDLDQVLDRILEQVERVVAGDAFNVMLIENGTARIVRWRGYEPRGVKRDSGAYSTSIDSYPTLSKMIQTGEPIVIPDTTEYPDWIADAGQEWWRSYVAAPVRVTGLTVGFLNVIGRQTGEFGPDDARRLEIFARHAAIAIENAQLYREINNYAEQLEERVRQRTAQIRAQYARLQAILSSTTDGIIVTDAGGDILQVNPVAQTWLTQTLLPEEADRLEEVVRDLAVHREERPEALLELKGLDLQLHAAPISEPQREGEAVVAVHDVSHLKALDRLKSRFVSNVSHELRTPITTIKLYIDLMQRHPNRAEEYLDALANEAERQTQLVEDILQISRIDVGRLEVAPRPIVVNELTETAAASHQVLADNKGVTLEHRPAEPGPMALADPERMMQVLNNLVANAVQYTPQGGRVTVSTGEQEADERTWVTVTVEDTGIGIPEEELPRIFDRFFRGEEPQRRQMPGTGLGLAIADEIARLHGGRVTVQSQVDVGSTFTVWLPPGERS